MRGVFTGTLPNGEPFEVQNRLVDEGEEALLKMIWQDSHADVAGAGNFYFGICGDTPAETLTLATLASEPSAAGSYARQPITRDATGWPTISKVNGVFRALSALATFTAVSVSFDTAIDRFFIGTTLNNTGKLLCMSGALSAPVTVAVGSPLTVNYNFYLD